MNKYTELLDLDFDPFEPSEKSRDFYCGVHCQEVLDQVVELSSHSNAMIAVTGPLGAGKTTLATNLSERFADEAVCIKISDTLFMNEKQFLEPLYGALGLKPAENSDVESAIEQICGYAAQLNLENRSLILIIDDAYELSAEVLQLLTRLLEGSVDSSIHVLLFSEEQLDSVLQTALTAQAQERLTAFSLDGFSSNETHEYIRFKLATAKLTKELPIDGGAIDAIHNASQGLPGAINSLTADALNSALSVSEPDEIEETAANPDTGAIEQIDEYEGVEAIESFDLEMDEDENDTLDSAMSVSEPDEVAEIDSILGEEKVERLDEHREDGAIESYDLEMDEDEVITLDSAMSVSEFDEIAEIATTLDGETLKQADEYQGVEATQSYDLGVDEEDEVGALDSAMSASEPDEVAEFDSILGEEKVEQLNEHQEDDAIESYDLEMEEDEVVTLDSAMSASESNEKAEVAATLGDESIEQIDEHQEDDAIENYDLEVDEDEGDTLDSAMSVSEPDDIAEIAMTLDGEGIEQLDEHQEVEAIESYDQEMDEDEVDALNLAISASETDEIADIEPSLGEGIEQLDESQGVEVTESLVREKDENAAVAPVSVQARIASIQPKYWAAAAAVLLIGVALLWNIAPDETESIPITVAVTPIVTQPAEVESVVELPVAAPTPTPTPVDAVVAEVDDIATIEVEAAGDANSTEAAPSEVIVAETVATATPEPEAASPADVAEPVVEVAEATEAVEEVEIAVVEQVEAVEVAIVAEAEVIAMPSPSVERLLQATPGSYALQLAAAHSEANISKFVADLDSDQPAGYFETRFQGKPWFVAVLWGFDDRDQAARAIASLPEALRSNEPWARSIVGIQTDIREQIGSTLAPSQ